MTRYEYIVQECHNQTKLQEYLSEYGRAGYRIAVPPVKISNQGYRIIMEREVVDEQDG